MAGNYNPTGVFSIEFTERLIPFLTTEIVFLLPPEHTQYEYGYRLKVHKTIGGSNFDDFGVDNPKFNISGSLWCPWIDTLPSPFGSGVGIQGALAGGNLASAASNFVQSFSPLNQMSGLDEFFRLKYALYDFWNDDAKYVIPSSLDALGPLPGLKIMTLWAILGKNNRQALGMVYHDYDDDLHWEVVPEGPLRFEKDKSDPFTVQWSINLTGLKDKRILPFLVPSLSKKINANAYMEQVAANMATLSLKPIIDTVVARAPQTFSELAKINAQGVDDALQRQLRDYRQKRRGNQRDLIYAADTGASTGFTIGQGIVDQTLAGAGIPPATYATESESTTPSQTVVDTGKDAALKDVAEYILSAKSTAAVEAYTGLQPIVTENKGGQTISDLPPIKESSFATATENPANTISYGSARWRTYVIRRGDNLGKIAQQQLGDYGRFPEIARLNNLKMKDFLLDGLAGKMIRLPETVPTAFNNPNNLVYKKFLSDAPNEAAIADETLGRDLAITENRDLFADNSGDMPTLMPADTFEQNLLDLINHPRGTLALFPEWGLDLPIGQPNLFQNNIVRSKYRNAIRIDPRVQNVEIAEGDVSIQGDTIRIKRIKVTSIIGREASIQV